MTEPAQYAYTVFVSIDQAHAAGTTTRDAAHELAEVIEYVLQQGWAWPEGVTITQVNLPRRVGSPEPRARQTQPRS